MLCLLIGCNASTIVAVCCLTECFIFCHAGIKRVLVPKRNWRDIQTDIPANVKSSIEVIPVHVLEDVLQQAFAPSLHLSPVPKL